MTNDYLPFWSSREQKAAIRELLQYIQEKFDQGLVHRCAQEATQYRFSVDTHLGFYYDVLFLEIERHSANWTKFSVTVWELKRIHVGGVMIRFRTFAEWKNGRHLGVPRGQNLQVLREMRVRVDIKLLKPEMTSAEMEEELQDVDREMDEG